MRDGGVGAHLPAAPAFDAFLLVDIGFFVYKTDGALRTHLAAGVSKTALTQVGDHIGLLLAGVAGKFDDIDKRRLIVGLRLCRLNCALRDLCRAVAALQGKTHGEADTFAYNGALEKYALAIGSHVSRDNLVRQIVKLVIYGVVILIGNACHLAEHGTPNFSQTGVHPTHRICHSISPLGQQAPVELASVEQAPRRRLNILSIRGRRHVGGTPSRRMVKRKKAAEPAGLPSGVGKPAGESAAPTC